MGSKGYTIGNKTKLPGQPHRLTRQPYLVAEVIPSFSQKALPSLFLVNTTNAVLWIPICFKAFNAVVINWEATLCLRHFGCTAVWYCNLAFRHFLPIWHHGKRISLIFLYPRGKIETIRPELNLFAVQMVSQSQFFRDLYLLCLMHLPLAGKMCEILFP